MCSLLLFFCGSPAPAAPPQSASVPVSANVPSAPISSSNVPVAPPVVAAVRGVFLCESQINALALTIFVAYFHVAFIGAVEQKSEPVMETNVVPVSQDPLYSKYFK